MSLAVSVREGEPREALMQWLDTGPREKLLFVRFVLAQPWQPEHEEQPLTAVYYVDARGSLHCSVTDRPVAAGDGSAAAQFGQLVDSHSLAVFSPGQPLRLDSCRIPKPWGQEIWFTGVEQRGVACFSDLSARVPIPWLQAVMPSGAAGDPGSPLVLLKILDPLPEAVTGDLYFELHEEKREVYVVTHVDERAWPDKIGSIRFGFCPQKLEQAGSEAAFRARYLEAVIAYEHIRREIDSLPAGASPSAAQLLQEQELREAMNSFTHLRPLHVGDVVVVPLRMPHSLQHGVRTIEFQTPVYERQILSFAQKVVTQDHWDTEAAVAKMRLLPPPEQPFEQLSSSGGVQVERVVDFPDFEVRRLHFRAGSSEAFNETSRYALVMVVSGKLALEEQVFEAEEAAFLPAGSGIKLRCADPAGEMVLLLALPRG